jgi:hypothetical protein
VGQQLKQQLRLHQLQQASPNATATAAPGDSNSDTAAAGTASDAALQRGGDGSADDLYYSSMPAAAGRQMALQLQQELQAGINRPPAAEGPAAVTEPRVSLAGGTSAAAAGVPASEDQTFGYYSSVPAAVGRQMALQLKQEQLKQQEDQQAPPSAAAAATGSLQESKGQPGASGGAEQAAADYYSSLPAAAGRTLQLQLQQELAGAEQQPSPASEADADGSAASEAAPPDSTGAPSSDGAHYTTMPALLGRSLQRELAQELAQQASAGARPPLVPGSFGDMRRPPRSSPLRPSAAPGATCCVCFNA